MDLCQITKKKGSIDKSHREILFHKKPKTRGSKQFYFESLLADKPRFVGFDKRGMPMNTTEVKPCQSASHFETH